MGSMETKLKTLALSLGADLVGITSRDILADGPPSADPCYVFIMPDHVADCASHLIVLVATIELSVMVV